jgi:hypothetical protein
MGLELGHAAFDRFQINVLASGKYRSYEKNSTQCVGSHILVLQKANVFVQEKPINQQGDLLCHSCQETTSYANIGKYTRETQISNP